jgi:glycosyltransferase involved in cell wall biosynthesis
VRYEKTPCTFFTDRLLRCEPFSISRWGDGEWNALLRLLPEDATNCDGHRYFRLMADQLARALKDVPNYFVAIQPLTLRLMGNRVEQWLAENSLDLQWHDADVFHDASSRGEIEHVFAALRAAPNLILVGPDHLRRLDRYVAYREFVQVPERDCFLSLEAIQDRILEACACVGQPAVISISAGMPANLIIHNLYPKIGRQFFLIDFGSVWDPYCGVCSRSYHHKLRIEQGSGQQKEISAHRPGPTGMIVTMIPYCPTKHGTNLGFAYNQQMVRLRDEDWACFIDHDAMFTTREWYRQLEAITQHLAEPAILTAKTNRVGSPWQIAPGVDPNNHSMEYHRSVGGRILQDFGFALRAISASDGYMSGVVILLSKRTWKLLGGFTDGFLGVDTQLHRTAAAKGVGVYLMEGVYVYHWYRADTCGPPSAARNPPELLLRISQVQAPCHLPSSDSETARDSTGSSNAPVVPQMTVLTDGDGCAATSRSSLTEIAEQGNYKEAVNLALQGQLDAARDQYRRLEASLSGDRQKAMLQNDLAALLAASGDVDGAIAGFQAALSFDSSFAVARENLELLSADAVAHSSSASRRSEPANPSPHTGKDGKVAILSFLFNWPSIAGGIVHTVELVQALERAGYAVQHFFYRDHDGLVGNVKSPLPIRSECLTSQHTVASIKEVFRRAVQQFDPDWVIVTDSWNFKPHLADAVCDYPYFLRFQALECLCPLNNLRLLVSSNGSVEQCPKHQLAAPDACNRCLAARSAQSGGLHQWERSLSGVGTAEYQDTLYRAISRAAAVLALNPLIAEMLRPYANRVEVVTWGMDPSRFPWPLPENPGNDLSCKTLLMAGMVSELIKGFHVLHDACALLWRKRQDFELLATGEPIGRMDDFTRLIGWQPQADLPRCIRDADVLIMPTIAQEGLGRTTVEAMAVGRPVIASRIGGLPYTVTDGLTGLLFEPGDAHDLASKIERLLDNRDLRMQMGEAGRRRFESDFTWCTVIERQYRPLLQKKTSSR